MLYRWGFIEEGVFNECKPFVDDDTALDFAQETGQIFYRAKLNGDLSFRYEFDDILAKGYGYTHIVVLQWYDNADDQWKELWRGHFTLTDCEIDYDSNTISVQPETQDRYTDILNKLEDEYNLLKLAPTQQPVGIMIRPCFQVYALNDSKIMNLIGGNTWQASCDSVGIANIANYHFRLIKNQITFGFVWQTGAYAGQFATYTAEINGDLNPNDTLPLSGKVYSGNDWVEDNTLTIFIYPPGDQYTIFGVMDSNNQPLFRVYYDKEDAGTDFMLNYQSEDVDDIVAQWNKIYARLLLQNDGNTWRGQPLYDLATDDMAGTNLNYNKISEITPIGIVVSDETQEDPTQWGLSYTDRYFVKPSTGQIAPIGQDLWKYVSYWFFLQAPYYILDADGSYHRQIRDCYTLKSAIMRLMEKAGWQGNQWVSKVLDGDNDYVGEAFIPVITPKSNVISSYYDTPAQKAPITLSMIFTMLKQAYKIYWHIDANNAIHVEHISFYENGYSYTEDEPVILVDLEAKTHTRTYESKVFGQNKVKFDKSAMPQHYNFSWMEKQTQAFDGFPIDALDPYVQNGQTEDIAIGDFDTDLDYVLSSPNDVSKEGFFLFACPAEEGVSDYEMVVEELIFKDQAGDINEVTMQNTDGAFVKIHDTYWRYDLPCENVKINNEDTNAITTGRFKIQTIEFADEVMAEILRDISNCVKAIRTQQGDGHIKSLSINLNSLAAKADLMFNFIGRFYYLRGAALGNSITIFVNGESVTIDIVNNVFKYRYNTPMSALNFNAADVVSVDFRDCDSLDNITSTEDMFKNCSELIAVDFGNKKLGAVTDATDMFAGCSQLTTLICPATSTWKPDLNFEDCPLLTTESIYSLIEYLFVYESGSHTITFNQTMWNALDPDVQTDIEARANAKGWQIGMAAAYFISGQSPASVVYATINGSAVEIEVENGVFNYGYRSPITSLSFEGDANVTDIDFSLSDGLAGLTSLDNAFKDCVGLTSVDFTNCDLSNVVSASDAFANCSSLYTLEIPTGTWKPDIDLSASVMPKTEMLNVIDGLFTYNTGTHTITFNSTIWDAMSVADQQAVFDAADAKGWITNAVAVVYVIRGTSSNVNGTESVAITFIDDDSLTPSAAETLSIAVDGNGNFEYSYLHKKIYSLNVAFQNNSTLLTISFSEECDRMHDMNGAFQNCANLTSIDFGNATFSALIYAVGTFRDCAKLTTIDISNATFASLEYAERMFYNSPKIAALDFSEAIFGELKIVGTSTWREGMFGFCAALTSLSFPKATFAKLETASCWFYGCTNLQSVTFKSGITLSNVKKIDLCFDDCTNLTTINGLESATFEKVTDMKGFLRNSGVTALDIRTANFVSMTDTTAGIGASTNGIFYAAKSLVSLNMSAATFSTIVKNIDTFTQCNSLTTLDVPQNSTAIVPTSSAANAPMDLRYSPLTYASMLKVASWLSDLTGYTAHTCTFKSSAWNALSSAEQSNIDSILSAKNWNRAIA